MGLPLMMMRWTVCSCLAASVTWQHSTAQHDTA
jgi:hypothetical protein